MSHPQPVAVHPVRPSMSAGRVLLFIGSAIAVGVLALAVVVTQFGSQSATVPPAPMVPVVDVSGLPVFWDSTYKAASWYGLTSVPEWDGNVLTARTSLFADSDAVEPAKAMCVAMSMFWAQSADGQFRSVRVLDKDGLVLVSRHTQADQCVWRR